MPTHTNPFAEGEGRRLAYSVPHLCEAIDISETTFYLLQHRDRGPRTFKVGRKRLVTHRHAEEWLERMVELTEEAEAEATLQAQSKLLEARSKRLARADDECSSAGLTSLSEIPQDDPVAKACT